MSGSSANADAYDANSLGSGNLNEKSTGLSGSVAASSSQPLIQLHGSVAPKEHVDGTCEPCILFTSRHGCARGDGCNYCHLEHPLSSTPRPRKQTRDKIKERILQIFRDNHPNLQDELQAEAREHPYASRIIHGYLEDDIPLALDPENPQIHARWDPDLGFIFSL